jgi:hypothetical protein
LVQKSKAVLKGEIIKVFSQISYSFSYCGENVFGKIVKTKVSEETKPAKFNFVRNIIEKAVFEGIIIQD